MKIAIFSQVKHYQSLSYIQIILNYLILKEIKVHIEKECFLYLKNEKLEISSNLNCFEKLDSSYDFLISIGGDGTILKSIIFIKELEIPIIGINTGRLGFLTSIKKENIEKSIDQIIKENYSISERSLVSITTFPDVLKKKKQINFALNEVVISRKQTTSMISVNVSLNSEKLTNYWVDGLIISTPTGSTGYSLSCGGPIIDTSCSNLVLTPIAPHNLNSRPLVISDKTQVDLTVKSREDEFLISLDSRILAAPIKTRVIIKKTPFVAKLVMIDKDSFFNRLREKLLWGENNMS